MWSGLWTERARFPDTAQAILYESQGLFEQAQETYEQVIILYIEYNDCLYKNIY